MQYYFLVLSLPPVSLQAKPEISFKEVMEFVRLNISSADLKKVQILLRQIDLYNIRALWLGLPFEVEGNFEAKELEELLLGRDELLPDYILDFLDQYDDVAGYLSHFASLFASLYVSQEVSEARGFLHEYYEFQREMRLTLTALRAKEMKKDIVRELQFEDVSDPFVSFILVQKDAVDFVPQAEYEDLKILFMENRKEPSDLHRAILKYQFEKLEEMKTTISFSVDQILIYIAQFLIVDQWFQLNKEDGQTVVDELARYG